MGVLDDDELQKKLEAQGLELGFHGSDGCEGPFLAIKDSHLSGDWEQPLDVPLQELAGKAASAGKDWDEALRAGLEVLREAAGEFTGDDAFDLYDPDCGESEANRYGAGQVYLALKDEKPRWFIVCSYG